MAEKDDVIQELTTRWAVAHEGTVPPHVYILKWNGEKNPDDVLVGGVKAENFTYDDQIVGAVMGRETKTLGMFARVAVFGGPERNEQVMAIATAEELETRQRAGSPQVVDHIHAPAA